MITAQFVIVLGVAIFVFASVAALYVVWARMVGLDLSVARAYTGLSRPAKVALATCLGAFVGATIETSPSIEAGIAVVVLLAASVFLGLMLFELVVYRTRATGAYSDR